MSKREIVRDICADPLSFVTKVDGQRRPHGFGSGSLCAALLACGIDEGITFARL